LKIIDLTHKIKDQMPNYPGTQILRIVDTAVMGKDGYREKSFSLTAHTGTHIDAPAHMIDNGKTIDEIDLSNFYGKAVVFNLGKSNNSILQDKVKKYLTENSEIKFLLFYTGWSDLWGKKEYYEDYPIISESLAKIIAVSSLYGIGIDTPSVDEIITNDYTFHKLFFKNNKIIIENMKNLRQLIDKKFQLYCFPLNINQGDGSPVRAVAFLNGGDD
jgi:arylformamidase